MTEMLKADVIRIQHKQCLKQICLEYSPLNESTDGTDVILAGTGSLFHVLLVTWCTYFE